MSEFILDTPMTFPAKFGSLGVTLLGLVAAVAALGFLAPPLEDKGLSFGLLLTLTLAVAETGRAAAARPEPGPG
jgi:hypothetical protein